MAKTKSKRNTAASIVPSMVEAVSGNDTIAESAPSESVENKEAAMTMVLDKSEELHKKEEEIKDGPDEAVEIDENEETKDGSDQFREVDNKEETKTGPDEPEEEETDDRPVESEEDKTEDRPDGSEEEETEDSLVESEEDKAEESEDYLDKSEDIDEMEETEDGLYNPEDEDGKEETENAVVESEDGEKVAKENENAVPMGTVVPEGKKFEEGAEMGTDVPGGEKVGEGAAIKEVKDLGKEEDTPKKTAKRIRKKKKKVASNVADKLIGADKEGAPAAVKKNKEGPPAAVKKDKEGAPAAVKKDMKMADGMGLIFMCNAKTKMDCFRYKVFGLPAGKKEMVAKIYKGMRLFLFDVDLKLLYGIYKAATPGGYNIEPKAFKSGFPAQVRFHVLNDCLPLPEEKFKAAIKGNYYGKNKFNCQLSPEQVKDLCKLFQSAGKTIDKKRPREVVRTETEQISSSRGQKRTRRERARRDDIIPRGQDSFARREAYPSLPPRSRDLAPRSRDVRAEPERTSSFRRQRSIRERTRRDDRIPRGRDPYTRIDVYSSPPPRALALPPPPLPQAPYAYGRPVDDYYYRREAPLLDPRDHRVVDLETRSVEPLGYRDPYSLYGEPLSREAGYRVPLSREAGYREPLPREPVAYQEAIYPTSSTPAVRTLYYRY